MPLENLTFVQRLGWQPTEWMRALSIAMGILLVWGWGTGTDGWSQQFLDRALDEPKASTRGLPQVVPIQFQKPDPIPLIDRPGPADPNGNRNPNDPNPSSARPTDQVLGALLGGVSSIDSLSESRKARTMIPSVDAVIGTESRSRETTDTGNLLGKSTSVRGVSSQQRTPIVTDTRIRGERVGQVLAAGSFWAPVRMDLDTMMSKIDSRLIDSLIIIKGPYSPRYGPGFSFVDIDMLMTPRYADGPQSHGSTSADYQTNGQQWYGRQTVFGGSSDWGYRVSYGFRTGNDYTAGDGTQIPSSYKSGDLNVAVGYDINKSNRLEFNYLRLDQSDLEFPGLVYDIDRLTTNGYEIKYFGTDPVFCDMLTSEVWYNRTSFTGNTFAPSKLAQIPQLSDILFSPSGTDGAAITNGTGMSLGHRTEAIFGELGIDHWALGTDFNLQRQALNDIEIFLPANDNNFPLARSRSADVGFFVEHITRPSDRLRTNIGGRVDNMNTNAKDNVAGLEDPLSVIKDAGLEQNFVLWSAYATADFLLTDHWTATSGLGFAERPPTLTELYVENAYIGSLQRGLTFLDGDPLLRPEKLKQIDVGLKGQFERWKCGVNAYHAWIEDFITYDLFTDKNPDGGLPQGASFVNTDLATLRGFDGFSRYEWTKELALFGTMSYVEGEDRTREKPARLSGNDPRSGDVGVPREALPGIAPFDSRVGLLWHDPTPRHDWGVELSARMVARQNRIAVTLEEVATPGFTTLDLRSFKRLLGRSMWTGGIENMTNRFYREHLDYRTGLGVFRPGINFYTGLEIFY